MTCKEKFIADHPNYKPEELDLVFANECPSDYGILDDPCDLYGNVVCHALTCIDCWKREVPNNVDAPLTNTADVLAELETKKENDDTDEKTELTEKVNELKDRLVELSESYADALKERDALRNEVVYKQNLLDDISKRNTELEEDAALRPVDDLPYTKIANHIRLKYQALIDQGFSHDDAMSLIPMWWD